MARWFQKKEEELPEKLRGKSEEDLVKAFDDAEATKASLTAKETELASLKTASDAQKTELETIKAKLAEIEAGGNKNTPQRRESDRATAGPASVFVDEEQAFNDRTAGLNARVTVSGSLSARLTAREAIENDKDGRTEKRIWDKYANEINTLMSKEAPDRQIDPRSWLNAFVYVKGLHFGELLESQNKKTDVFAEVGGSTGNGMDDSNKDADKDKLTPAELDIAKKFKMTPEKYLERKKNMKFVAAP